jgi:NTP pyrophosphatase (non-canonical NTP hydrolase)
MATKRKRKVKLRPAVAWFAEQMELKLRENDHKGGWEDCDIAWLCKRIADERGELKRAISRRDKSWGSVTGFGEEETKRVIREAADVGAFAMMIADNVKEGR